MKRIGPTAIRALLPCLDAEVFSAEVFAQTGIFIVRRAVPRDAIECWQRAWRDFYESKLTADRRVSRFNPVSIDDPVPPPLDEIHKHPALLDIVEKAFGPDIGLYNQRFLIKDESSRGPVFLHHDIAYHLGSQNKASAFVPLSAVTPEGGGLFFYPGTHQFGSLGDAGEINLEVIGADWPSICPSLEPGDVALMNSCTWLS